jgi:hypothetical protein
MVKFFGDKYEKFILADKEAIIKFLKYKNFRENDLTGH